MAAGDPVHPDFGKTPIDLDKYRSIGVQPTDRSGSTRTTRTDAGHEITHHWSDDARQDVTIHAKPVTVGIKTT